jgi:hypothetical protein
MPNCKFVVVFCLDKYTSSDEESCNRMIGSQSGNGPVPVKRTTATIVRPPLVAIFNERDPASRYCDWAWSKVTWPFPCGPPDTLYTGRMPDPSGALARVHTDANEGFAATRAKNLAQTVLEYKERTQVAGQVVQAADPADALYLPATHAVHVPPSGPENPALQVHTVKEALEVSAVTSTPRTMRSTIADVASVSRYSSTTKAPAMSPLK